MSDIFVLIVGKETSVLSKTSKKLNEMPVVIDQIEKHPEINFFEISDSQNRKISEKIQESFSTYAEGNEAKFMKSISKLDAQDILLLVNILYSNDYNIDPILKLISNQSNYSQLSDEVLQYICESDDFSPKNPEVLIKELVCRKMYINIPKYINRRALSILAEDASFDLNIIRPAIMQYLLSIQSNDSSCEFPIDYKNPQSGVLAHLLERSQLFSSVKFSSSPTKNLASRPEAVFSTPHCCFISDNGPIAWILIEFTKPFITFGYTIISGPSGSKGFAPISWRLEGSEDGKTFYILSEHINNKCLLADNAALVEPVYTDNSYRFYRIVQLESGSNLNSAFTLSYYDLFGSFQ